jgi:hypothetical protein
LDTDVKTPEANSIVCNTSDLSVHANHWEEAAAARRNPAILSIGIARGTPFWIGNRHAGWKAASRFVTMGRRRPLDT